MVGALAGTQLIPLERKAFEEIIRESFPAAQVADNLKAFKRGMEMTQGF
jgi:Pyruvate/2-oxoacid:ferredoxin oxidoreductase gamma subunit